MHFVDAGYSFDNMDYFSVMGYDKIGTVLTLTCIYSYEQFIYDILLNKNRISHDIANQITYDVLSSAFNMCCSSCSEFELGFILTGR